MGFSLLRGFAEETDANEARPLDFVHFAILFLFSGGTSMRKGAVFWLRGRGSLHGRAAAAQPFGRSIPIRRTTIRGSSGSPGGSSIGPDRIEPPRGRNVVTGRTEHPGADFRGSSE